jgi:hypothetical protein
MAKISARGCHKVAGASKMTRSESGSDVRVRLVLRSDGKMLRAIDVHHATGYPSRGGFSIVSRRAWTRDEFIAYADRHGYSVDTLREIRLNGTSDWEG